jgi:DNA-binding transcriptional ArsR family regulator
MSSTEPQFATVAALLGDPARANIVRALMDGRARTAKELASVAGVTAQTASGHLGKLVAADLLSVLAQGRHRYYRLANSLVACTIESLMALAGERPLPRHRHNSALTGALRSARTCYDHLAGRLGVRIHDHLLHEGCLLPGHDGDGHDHDYEVSPSGRLLLAKLGIDVDAVARQKRGFARPCLDWSERVPHLAGGLGAAIAGCCFERGWIARRADSRAVRLTAAGAVGLKALFGIDAAAVMAGPDMQTGNGSR